MSNPHFFYVPEYWINKVDGIHPNWTIDMNVIDFDPILGKG